MEASEVVKTEGGDVEKEHVQRLMALLHEVVRKEGSRKGAARALGIDRRTVGACMDGGGMTWRLREALERGLRDGVGSSAARHRKRHDALERRVEKLAKELHEGLDVVRGEVKTLGEEQGRALAKIEGELTRLETTRESTAEPAEAQDATGDAPEKAPATDKPSARARYPKRLYPELVTKEPAPDDEEVFGAAWPLIEEWREIWKAGHVGTGKGLAWLETEARVRSLEVALLEEHGMTLPPETEPLHGLYRSTQLTWRRDTLVDVRRALAWRYLLWKALTCGLWRSRWWPARRA